MGPLELVSEYLRLGEINQVSHLFVCAAYSIAHVLEHTINVVLRITLSFFVIKAVQ